jgi:hypothetical protein
MKRAVFALVILSLVTTRADVIVGHGVTPGSATINPSGLDGYESWAQSFTTPAITYELTSASALLSGNGNLVVASLWDTRLDPNSSFLTLPGKKLADLGSAVASAPGVVTFNSFSGVTLQPQQSYWLLLTASPNDPVNLMEIDYPGYNNNTAQIGTGTYGLRSLKGNAGQDLWTIHPGVYNIRVEGTVAAVPEPSTMALAFVALGLFAVRRLRLRVYNL